MKISILLTLELTTEGGDDIEESRRCSLTDDTLAAIQNRMFGEGFLPPDVLVEIWDARTI